jgi:hypothetical protein
MFDGRACTHNYHRSSDCLEMGIKAIRRLPKNDIHSQFSVAHSGHVTRCASREIEPSITRIWILPRRGRSDADEGL